MLYDFLFYLFVTVSVVNIAHLGMYLVGANIYDIKSYKDTQKSNRRNRRKLAPLVSILIPAHNEEESIIRCIDSVRRNTYRKIEIIVIDDASTDNTKQLVRDYISKYPNRSITLTFRRINQGKAQALNHALKRKARGELVMTLDGDSVLDRFAIKRAVNYFSDPKVVGVAANVRVMESMTVLGLLQRFEHMVGYRSKKFYSVSNSEYIIGGVASTYQREVIKKVRYYDHDTLTEDIGLSLKVAALGNKANRLVYGVDVMASTEGVHSFKALLNQRYRWKMGGLQNIVKHRQLALRTPKTHSMGLSYYRIPMAFIGEAMLLAEPLLLAYVIYLSIISGNFAMFAGAYMIVSLYIMLVLAHDEHTRFRDKTRLVGYIPILYFVFFIMNVVQLISILRCAANYKLISGKRKVSGTWISPERLRTT